MANITDPEVLINEALKLEPEDRQALLKALLPRIYSAQFVVLGPIPKRSRPGPRIREIIADDDAGVFVDVEGNTTIFIARLLKMFFPDRRREDVRCAKELLPDHRQLITLELDYGPDRTWSLYLNEIRPQHLDYFHISAQSLGHTICRHLDG